MSVLIPKLDAPLVLHSAVGSFPALSGDVGADIRTGWRSDAKVARHLLLELTASGALTLSSGFVHGRLLSSAGWSLSLEPLNSGNDIVFTAANQTFYEVFDFLTCFERLALQGSISANAVTATIYELIATD